VTIARILNDPKQSQVAGHATLALMPKGEKGSHATVGWMRFYGLTPRAQANSTRLAARFDASSVRS
jgi:multiple sugar transport system substrate-binding protein